MKRILNREINTPKPLIEKILCKCGKRIDEGFIKKHAPELCKTLLDLGRICINSTCKNVGNYTHKCGKNICKTCINR